MCDQSKGGGSVSSEGPGLLCAGLSVHVTAFLVLSLLPSQSMTFLGKVCRLCWGCVVNVWWLSPWESAESKAEQRDVITEQTLMTLLSPFQEGHYIRFVYA